MQFKKYQVKIAPNRLLEEARAREIFRTWETDQDKEKLLFSVRASIKWFDEDGVKRILNYIKEMRDGNLY
jgi:hypothetical protein